MTCEARLIRPIFLSIASKLSKMKEIELVNDENEATQIIGLLEKPWFD